ncbi:hypothetical protein GCM10009550_15120 [Actinocorallia libanotica]|uniref:Uncharacterized protein n=1 Tax=Actinocorallia libanotica TaxID=46162 RepID=A0ABP4AYC9_9ACTN
MHRAHEQITEVCRDAPHGCTGLFFDAPHCFDVPMREAAFAWLTGIPMRAGRDG